MDLDIKGKIAIVTGGSVGIGRSISEVLSNEGVKVTICSRGLDSLKNTAIDISKKTGIEATPTNSTRDEINIKPIIKSR